MLLSVYPKSQATYMYWIESAYFVSKITECKEVLKKNFKSERRLAFISFACLFYFCKFHIYKSISTTDIYNFGIHF